MRELYLTLCTFVIIGVVNCQYYFVTAPNVIRFEHDETVVVSVFGLNNARVKVGLQYKGRKFSEREVVVVKETEPTTTLVRVKESDIFGISVAEDKPRTLQIYSEFQGSTQLRDVVISYQSGYLIVQTDKPIYTPQQKVKIRTLALEESLKPSTKQVVAMEIISPTNLTMARQSISESLSGFFTHEFTLPPYPDMGTWTARAFYKGQFETTARALFQVKEYVLPTFGVTVDVDVPYILPSTKIIPVTVQAKYVYGKPVEGKVRLQLNLKDKLGLTEHIKDMKLAQLQNTNDIEGSVKEFRIETLELLKDRAFPDGSRLEVIAWVFETATGKEEARSNDNAVFTNNPYRFYFSKSKVNFRPGWEYYLKVEVTFANGKPADKQDVSVHTVENGKLGNTQVKKTGSGGQLNAIFTTTNKNDKMTFRASIGEVESEDFVISPYAGKNQIQVESNTVDEELMTMRAFTNMDINGGHTGMLFMVVTRGKVVHYLYGEPTLKKTTDIPENLQEYITPSARLLVFYVDKSTGELVADSIRFDVKKKCQKELTLETRNPIIGPGKEDYLKVKGSPFMWVGLNVMDKALLLLNDKNVLDKNKMFEALASHDLGCGEGSGKSSGDVFKKSGLTVLTNAVVSNEDLKRETDTCANMKRRKRHAEDCYGADQICCEQGYNLADRLYDEVVDHAKLDPYTKCYAKARELALQRKLSTKCIMAFFHSCRKELEESISEVTKISSKSLSDDEDYASDLAKLAEHRVQFVPRSDFRESWNFETVQLNNEGQFQQGISYPDSITEWMFQAVGITEDNGMCIADPLTVKAYKDFFIQLDLPYKAVRMENLNLKATIFNYGLPSDNNKSANVYIEGVEGLCFNTESGKPSPKIQVDLPPNSAQTVAFPMIPWKAGQFPIKVSAIVAGENIAVVDAVEKKLFVVNEGIQEKETLQICLDPNKDKEDCKNDPRVIEDVTTQAGEQVRTLIVDLTLPENAISGTGVATGYIQSNIMDNVVTTLLNGVDTLFRQPSGCGEQTMILLAPTVYAMSYLKRTRQITNDIEEKGNKWIRDGIVYMVSQYRHADGAYSAWRGMAASTWLTAFVAKVFCQAKAVVDNAFDDVNDIQITLKWLTDHVQADGSFVDNMPVIHREMIGQINEKDPSLTSFVLLSLSECFIRTPDIEMTINKAMKYVENLDRNMLKNNPYILALSTYALAMTSSEKKWEFKTLLETISQSDGRDMYWGNPGGRPASANSVETTAYALLAMLKLNEFSSSGRIVRWLTSQRDAQGSFRTTQDTVVGLQALSTYSHRTYSPDVDLKISLLGTDWSHQSEFAITKENAIVQRIAPNLPVERGDNRLTVKVQGSGSGRMMIDLRYNRPAKDDEICPFHISDIEVHSVEDSQVDYNLAKDRNCDVCGICDEPEHPDYDPGAFGAPVEPEPKIESNFGKRKRRADQISQSKTCIKFSVKSKTDKVHGMSIVNFGLETDVEVEKEDLDKLMSEDKNIARYELPSSGSGFIVFYLDQITPVETKFIFRLKDNYERNKNTRQPSSIKVYDYYDPDQHCTKIYGTGSNKDISVECDDDVNNKKQYRCVQSLCAQPIDQEIVELVQKRQQPAMKLLSYTCNPEKANYAVLVKIPEQDLFSDKDKGEAAATGTVIKRIHKGIENINTGDEMTFFWKLHCQHTELLVGKQYYIIGKDGYTFKKGIAEEYRYPLMGTTLIIEDKNDGQLVDRVMGVYEQLMLTRGCAS